ncbi:thiopurine S-methyltransferase [Colwelliaceae bacterium 6471]
MDAKFWHNCWEQNSLGFHQEQVHPFLIKYFDTNLLPSDKHVLVPLCGKSLDMVWLAERMAVSGAELSNIACRDFFEEKSLPYQQEIIDEFNRFNFDQLTLWQGDFFKLTPAMLAPVDWIYDRAALIALPKAMQQQYVEHLSLFIAKQTKMMLITLEFPESELSGPPFPVFETDIKRLFADFNVECIASHQLKDKQFAQRKFNVSSLTERLYLISRQ